MLPEPGSPADWLRHARSDLALARTAGGNEVLRETLCYHAQQAAEKSLKALLLHQGITFPRTHNLRVLLDLFPQALPTSSNEAAELSNYAVMARYPGSYEAVTGVEYARAV